MDYDLNAKGEHVYNRMSSGIVFMAMVVAGAVFLFLLLGGHLF